MYNKTLPAHYILYKKTRRFQTKVLNTKKHFKKTVVNIFYPLISGALTAFSFYSENLAFMVFFSLIPIFTSLIYDFCTYKIFAYSMSLYISNFMWISNISSRVTENTILRILVSVFLVLILSVVLSILLTLPFTALKFLRTSNTNKLLLTPFIYIFGEWLQEAFQPIAFPWLRLGNIISCYPIFIQSASVLGTLFVSLFVLYVNVFATLLIFHIKSPKKYIFALCEIVLVSSELIFGYMKINETENYIAKSSVTIVQGNYAKNTKFTASTDEILEKYVSLASQNKNADIILFPETSMHSDVYKVSKLKEKMYSLCKNNQSIVMFGSQYKKDDKYYNACMALFPNKKCDAVYLKKYLVPFGEYSPINISSLHFTSKDFSSGYECNPIEYDKGKIGCVICFESIFSKSVLNSTRNGAEAITVLTNDSWLGEKVPLYQHHSHSIMRAVESSRYVLTSTNTGISSVADPHGKIIACTEINKADSINSNFYMSNKISLYTKIGNVIIIPSCIIILYSCTKGIIRKF